MVIKITHKQTMYFSKTIHRIIIKILCMDHKGIPKLMQISSKIILPLPIYFNLKHKIILICGHNQCKILLIYFPIPQMYFNQIHISKHNNTKLLHNKIYSNNLNNNNRIYSNNHNRCKIPSHNHNNK